MSPELLQQSDVPVQDDRGGVDLPDGDGERVGVGDVPDQDLTLPGDRRDSNRDRWDPGVISAGQ